jgi:drug/metabolite transporter (DMT)-like permease
MNTLTVSLIMAIVSPFIWGFMNTLDKFVVSRKIKNPLSYTLVAGLVNLCIGVILALFLDWSNLTLLNLGFPLLAGVIFGSQFFLYYYMLSKEDVSDVIGWIYVYPIIVALLSFFFINEKLSLISYVGMGLILFGALMLSIKSKKIKIKVSIWAIISLILIVALYEFFIKIATASIPELNGISLSCIAVGLVISLGFIHKKTRKGFTKELKNIKWAILVESLTFFGIFTTYYSMAGLPATVVSSLAATQPLTVLIIEKIFYKAGYSISKDKNFLSKLIPISLIVLGVIIMYSQELMLLLF